LKVGQTRAESVSWYTPVRCTYDANLVTVGQQLTESIYI